MRIRETHVHGYGRLADCRLAFGPGLQIILGPNERGKSTIRCFITDMLFGQRRDGRNAGYEEGNELRLPWDNPETYGGRMIYQLDDGRAFAVERTFHRGRERVLLTDPETGADLSAGFEGKPGGPAFAEAHLGLGKAVFINAATIGHLSLDGLGDEEGLAKIRDRLLSITDTGGGAVSADGAMRAIQARIEAIGRPDARTRPLPALRLRLAELDQEHAAALEALRGHRAISLRRAELRGETARLETLLRDAEERLLAAQSAARAARLAEAGRTVDRINEITQRCFALRPHADTPADRLAEAQQAAMLAETARLQTLRSEAELAAVQAELAAAERQITEQMGPVPVPVPEETERRYHDLRGNADRLAERLAEAEQRLRAAEEQVCATQNRLAGLPDFSRAAPDPVEWITQLAGSYTLALRARDGQRAERDRLRAEAERRRAECAPDAALFRECDSFSERLREFEVARRQAEEKKAELENDLLTLQSRHEDSVSRAPGFAWPAGLCAAFILLMLAATVYSGKTQILYAAFIVLLAMAFFIREYRRTRRQAVEIAAGMAAARGELEALAAGDEGLSPVDMLLRQANCETLRELEARYDRHREAANQLGNCLRDLERHELLLRESEARVPKFYERLRETFEGLGETLAGDHDVQNAVGRVISRYQEYREAKRRMAELRNTLQQAIERRRELAASLEIASTALHQTEAQIRSVMEACGFDDASIPLDTLAALRAYADHVARHENARGRLDTLRRQAEAAAEQLETDRAAAAERRAALDRLLSAAGAGSVEEWQERAEKAREYWSLHQTRTVLEEQLQLLLEGGTLQELRRAVEALPPPENPPAMPVEALEAECARLTAELEAVRAEAQSLVLAAAERMAGLRPLNDIEEERAMTARRIAALSREFDAAVEALSVIEDVASARHGRIAPIIAREASSFLGRITGGAHGELRIGQDFRIALRTASTDAIEKSLSKGALDQVYLSLRIALVRFLCRNGEKTPMLLDDPFANYDDQRLRAALALLGEIAREHQVLLFTCREDVALAATEMGAPVLEM